MGGVASTLFLSTKFWHIINKVFIKNNFKEINWTPLEYIKGFVMDSGFVKFKKTIKNLISVFIQ